MCTHLRATINTTGILSVKKREYQIGGGSRIPLNIVYKDDLSLLDNGNTLRYCTEEGIIGKEYLPPVSNNPFIRKESISDYWGKLLLSYIPLMVSHYKERGYWWECEGLLIAVIRKGQIQYGEESIVTSLITEHASKEINSSGLVHDRVPFII